METTPNSEAVKQSELWSAPQKLSDYALAPREIGVYLIGEMIIAPPLEEKEKQDNFLGEGWPHGFFPLYIGISCERKYGVRKRLSSHARSKGNIGIANLIDSGKDLYFIYLTGAPEHLLIEGVLQASLGGEALSCNVRVEYLRQNNFIHDLIHKTYSKK